MLCQPSRTPTQPQNPWNRPHEFVNNVLRRAQSSAKFHAKKFCHVPKSHFRCFDKDFEVWEMVVLQQEGLKGVYSLIWEHKDKNETQECELLSQILHLWWQMGSRGTQFSQCGHRRGKSQLGTTLGWVAVSILSMPNIPYAVHARLNPHCLSWQCRGAHSAGDQYPSSELPSSLLSCLSLYGRHVWLNVALLRTVNHSCVPCSQGESWELSEGPGRGLESR